VTPKEKPTETPAWAVDAADMRPTAAMIAAGRNPDRASVRDGAVLVPEPSWAEPGRFEASDESEPNLLNIGDSSHLPP
jgi:hypothetical protein